MTEHGVMTGKPLIESDRVEGTSVYDPQGNDIGSIKRVMIEKISGRVAYAVMSFGGFLGMGAEEHAIPWSKLTYDTSLGGYRTDITESQLRGAPAMRYQGEQVAQAEAELRWQFYKRWSLVGFAGTGLAQADIQGEENDRSVVTGGTGFRYEVARKYGIHAGVDIAWGPDETAVYIQVGSAWMRP